MATIEDHILSDSEKTFQYDKDLLHLPVPDLKNTLKKYLESVQPLVSSEEFKRTELIVQQFAEGDGRYLNEKLKEKAREKKNWLEEWWEQVAYLEVRLPRPMVNMAGPGPYHEDIWPALPGSRMQRQALILYYTLKFWEFIRKERHKPLRDGKGRPQCMYQFRRVFNTCNIPGVQRDKLVDYFKTESEGTCPSHVLVTSKGHIFLLETHDESGEILTPPELQSQLQRIRDRSLTLEPAQGIPYLTSEERTRWAQARSYLVSLHPHNYEVLEKIQSSVLGLWMEDGDATDASDLGNKALLGCGDNRWWDKSLSFGVYENGLSISNADHTPTEGLMMVYVTSYVHAKIRETKGNWQGTTEVRSLPEPELIHFVLDDTIKNAVKEAKRNHAKVRECALAVIRTYSKFGKNYCKMKKIHPDVFCQLALQLAYFTLFGKVAPTYETAPIKQFYHGRTETMRSCTNEAKAWCTSMADPSATNEEKYRFFQAAVNKHGTDFAEACEFRASDRHLLGIFLIAKEESLPVPLLYEDASFYKSGGGGNFILSTSCIGYSSVIGAVLPMCENGFGIFYNINEEQFTFFITTWNADKDTSSEGFADAICDALDAMRNIIDHEDKGMPAKL